MREITINEHSVLYITFESNFNKLGNTFVFSIQIL